MATSNDFSVIIQTVLNQNGVKTGLNEIQDFLNKNLVKIEPTMNTTSLKNNLKSVSSQLATEINKTFNTNLTGNDVFKVLNQQIQTTTTKVSKLATEQQKLSTTNSIKTWANANSASIKKFGSEIDSMVTKLSTADDLTVPELNKIQTEFTQLKISARDAGTMGLSLGDKYKQAFSSFTTWVSATTVIMGAVNTVKQMVSAVEDIDTAMTSLYKVTDETSERYNEFLDSATEKAKELGASVSDVVTQTAEWAQRGYSLDDAETMASASIVYSNVGDVDNETAVEDLTTALKAYNLTAEDAITIVDKLNEVSNNYAVSAADLGEGLSNSASALSLAGNDIDETIAMITSMTEVTQDASESGNALKVLSMRLRGASTDLENYGEDTDGVITSTSNLQASIEALTNVDGSGGIDIMTDDENFKSTYEIMQEISEVWNDISDVNQASLLQIIAGKQRGNSISALLTNMAEAEDVYTTATESAGSATEENEKYLESIEGKTEQFEAAFQSLSNTVIDSNLVKTIVDGGTETLTVLDDLISTFGTMPTIISGIGIAGLVQNFGSPKMHGFIKCAKYMSVLLDTIVFSY